MLAGNGQEMGGPVPGRGRDRHGGRLVAAATESQPHAGAHGAAIVALRLTRQWGPQGIAAHLQLTRSTEGKVLARYRMPRLACLDLSSRIPTRLLSSVDPHVRGSPGRYCLRRRLPRVGGATHGCEEAPRRW